MSEVLLHIGYPKTAATFLTDYFSRNPYLEVEGIPFNMRYIQTGKISVEMLKGKPGNKYYIISEEQLSVWSGILDIVGIRFKPYDIKKHQEETCRSLHSIFPDAKVLIITRGFKSAYRSMYAQYVSIGGIYSFKEFQKHYSNYFADFYDYDFLIRLYKNYFKEKIVILPFELLQENSTRFLAVLNERCGLPHFGDKEGKVNVSLYEKLESYRRLSSIIFKMIQPFPYRIQVKIYQLYSFLLQKQKLSWLPNFIPTEKELHIEEATVNLFKGKADILQSEKMFQPYFKEYMLV